MTRSRLQTKRRRVSPYHLLLGLNHATPGKRHDAPALGNRNAADEEEAPAASCGRLCLAGPLAALELHGLGLSLTELGMPMSSPAREDELLARRLTTCGEAPAG